MSKKMDDLREVLFATLQGVKDGSVDLDKARAINELGKTLTDTAKVEVDYLRVTAGASSGFMDPATTPGKQPGAIAGVTRHLLQG
jgi:hypothetical protein